MSYKIIVARYNENIDWLNDDINNCIIYNKGNKLNITNEIILKNVGRESETYLNYIINNYNNLPDIVIFTQANIADHLGQNNISYLMNLKNEALLNNKSYARLVHFDNNNNIHWDKEWNLQNGKYYFENNYKNNQPKTFINWFTEYISFNYPNPINIYTNAIFAVKKELILQNSLEYYNILISQVNHHINSSEGHFFERSWYYIFN